ncbi:MAG: DUF6495 family protein [Cyclobacteriaceae bacterium]
MKYRLLTIAELEELEKEFVDYLVVNGITADDWMKMKAEEVEKADQIIELFSDVVFEGVMRKVKFLDVVTPKSIKTFQCLSDRMVLVGLDAGEHSSIDFTAQSLAAVQEKAADQLSVYTSEKTYSKDRELELFDMTQRGATISDGTYFKALCLLL